jgi:molecular chaperone GrpE
MSPNKETFPDKPSPNDFYDETAKDESPEASGHKTGDSAGEDSSGEPSLEQEVLRYRDLALRAQADLDNYRKRMVREKEESVRYANSSLLERLLPVLDSFELGLQAARKAPGAEALVQGFNMVEKQLQDFLRESGVDAIQGEGSPFDPNLHEAVSHQPHHEIPEGHVSQQIRRGYKLRDRLLRPATVIVSKGPPAPGETIPASAHPSHPGFSTHA